MINELREGVKNIVRRGCPESGPFWSADIPPTVNQKATLSPKSLPAIDFKKKNSNVAEMMRRLRWCEKEKIVKKNLLK
jgi:hypothetical protein